MFRVFDPFLSAKSNLICKPGAKIMFNLQNSINAGVIINIHYMINLIDIQRLAVKSTLI